MGREVTGPELRLRPVCDGRCTLWGWSLTRGLGLRVIGRCTLRGDDLTAPSDLSVGCLYRLRAEAANGDGD